MQEPTICLDSIYSNANVLFLSDTWSAQYAVCVSMCVALCTPNLPVSCFVFSLPLCLPDGGACWWFSSTPLEWIKCAVQALPFGVSSFWWRAECHWSPSDSVETLQWDLISRSAAWRAEGNININKTHRETLLTSQISHFFVMKSDSVEHASPLLEWKITPGGLTCALPVCFLVRANPNGTLSAPALICFPWPSYWHSYRENHTKGFVTVVNEHTVKDNFTIKTHGFKRVEKGMHWCGRGDDSDWWS